MSLSLNPILPGFNPDPSIVRVGDDYFIATSTFEYFPGVPIYHSKDLVNWKLIGHALNRITQLDMRTVEPGAGVWAPTLREHKGRIYMTTACVYLRSRKVSRSHSYVGPENDSLAYTSQRLLCVDGQHL
jgi:beta-xylosidase